MDEKPLTKVNSFTDEITCYRDTKLTESMTYR